MHKFVLIFIFLALLIAGGIGLFFYVDINSIEEAPYQEDISENIESSSEIIQVDEEIPLVEDNFDSVSTEKAPEEEIKVESPAPTTPIVVEEIPVEEPATLVPPPNIEEVMEAVEDKVEEEILAFRDININTREALVNIFCITDGYNQNISPISGSGTIIDKRGVILTNAHIAQHLLLENYPVEGFVNCLIRTGSPAKAMYKATLLYISTPWISENADALTTENPTGTGEHDFALLLIDEALNGLVLPTEFPFIDVDVKETSVEKGDELLVGAYPAGLLGGKTIQQSLYASTAITTAMDLFTFESGSLDLISLGGTVVAQQGSSGGAVVNNKGKMVGLISTSSNGETTADRDLRAISLSHIERSLIEDNNTTLDELLSGNINEKAVAFNETTAETLLQILISTFLAN